MKKRMTFNILAVAIFAFAGCAISTNQAKADGPQLWRGTGVLFAADGTPQGDYALELSIDKLDNGELDQKIKVSMPEQKPILMSQRISAVEKGFKITSDVGNGGGLDLGDGFFTTYTTDDKGVTFASSIFAENDQMRILRYELHNGKAVRFFRETLNRQ